MILDGRAVSKKILENVKNDVIKLEKQPHLVVILVGNDPASQIYVRNKQKAAQDVGIKSTVVELSEIISEQELIDKINELMAPYDIQVDFDKDVVPLSKFANGGSITERHLMYALAKKIMKRFGKGEGVVRFLTEDMGVALGAKAKGS